MPLYEYKCDNCGDVFELIQRFSDTPLSTHEKCGGGPVHRLLSAPALHFKGTGWYITDYAKSGSSSPDKAEKSDKSEKNGPGKAAAESKSSSSSGSDSKSSSEKSSSTEGSKPSSPASGTSNP